MLNFNKKINSFFNFSCLNLHLQSKQDQLEKSLSSYLLHPALGETSLQHQGNDALKHCVSELEKSRLSNLYKTFLKIGSFFQSIFQNKTSYFQKILKLDELSTFLQKKHVEILNYQTLDSIKIDLSSFQKNANLSEGIKIGLLELEKYQINLYSTSLQKAKKLLQKRSLTPDDQKAIFTNLPYMIQQRVLEYGKSLGLDLEAIPANLQTVVRTKNSKNKSFIKTLELSYHNQIKDLERSLTEKKEKILGQNDISFDDNTQLTSDRYVIDCSTDKLTNSLRSGFLKKPIHVAMVAVEYSGLVKEGGLAEAVEGLSKGLKESHPSNKVTVVYPKFSNLPPSVTSKLGACTTHLTAENEPYRVYTYLLDNVEIKLIDHPAFTLPEGHRSIYGPDELHQQERFAVFNLLATDYLLKTEKPDIIHLHDWHSAGILSKIKKDHQEAWESGQVPPVIFTFHNNNRASQGRAVNTPYSYKPVIEGYIKKGILGAKENLFVKTLQEADVVTTVSETFALESQQLKYGEGISFATRQAAKHGKLFGIINGTNPYRWNPENDSTLKTWKNLATNEPLDLSYGPMSDNILEKKALIKQQLGLWIDKYLKQEEGRKFTFDPTKPLITYVGRFDSYQKGLDKLEEAIESTLKHGGQFICMGMGEDSGAKQILDNLEKKYKDGVLFIRDFKDASGKIHYQQGDSTRPGVGSLIRACSEFIFVPSRFEPCGLVQFEGWLFGSLAIGSKTGGLADTIKSAEKHADKFNGFLFCREGVTDKTCSACIENALNFWKLRSDEEKNSIFKRLIEEGRKYGWDSSPEGFSPLEKYRFVYELARKSAKQRRFSKKALTSVQDLKLLPYDRVSEFTKQEEEYLYHFYNADQLGISAEKLKDIFNSLPSYSQQVLPDPFGKGVHFKQYKIFGNSYDATHKTTRFALSAPYAKSVVLQLFDESEQLVAEHAMKKDDHGCWILPSVTSTYPRQRYLYKINNEQKLDPFGRGVIPSKSSKNLQYSVITEEKHTWNDKAWMSARKASSTVKKPLSIFEVHPTTWLKKDDGSYLNYRELAPYLVKHAKNHGFSHIELMGILEHPDERSWGYQPTGFFAPNHRMGSIDDLKWMIDYLHQNNVGTILDFVPGQFADDSIGLKNFDGSSHFEPSLIKKFLSLQYWFYHFGGNHFDLNKKHVRDFLISSAHFWLKEMHIDALRVDCVAGLLHADNKSTNSKNFLKDLNAIIHKETPGAISIAEDFSSDPLILRDLSSDGLGFDYRWDPTWTHFALEHFNQKQLLPSKKNDQLIKKALSTPEHERQIGFYSHDQTKQAKAQFHSTLSELTLDQRIKRIQSFLAFLISSNRNFLLFSGLEQLNINPWDLWIGSTKSFSSIPDAKQEQIKQMLSALSQIKTQEKALALDTKDITAFLEDPKMIVQAYRKTHDNSSIVILHNLTEQERKSFVIKVKKQEGVTTSPVQIFSSSDSFLKESSRQPLKISTQDDGEYISYQVDVPAETTLIIKES